MQDLGYPMTSKIVHRGGGKLFFGAVDRGISEETFYNNFDNVELYYGEGEGRHGEQGGSVLIVIHPNIKCTTHNNWGEHPSELAFYDWNTKTGERPFIACTYNGSGFTYILVAPSMDSVMNYNSSLYNIHDIEPLKLGLDSNPYVCAIAFSQVVF